MATVENMDQIIIGELDRYAGLLPEVIIEAQKAAAKQGVKMLKKTSPVRTGEYAKAWKSKTEKKRTGGTTVIYNSEKPGLVHLLEFGHAKVTGGRTKAMPHVEPEETEVARIYEEELKRRVEDGP